MVSPDAVVAVTGALVVGLVTALVYRDAVILEMNRPWLWAGLVFATMLGALTLHLAVGTVPIPGLLVIAVGGIALYLFERDDAVHGDEPADPRVLAGNVGVGRAMADREGTPRCDRGGD